MARYIDADKFAKRLKVSPVFYDFGQDGYFMLNFLLDLIDRQQVSDVVPKSEVEQLNKELTERIDQIKAIKVELEAMRTAANSYKMHYEKAKSEVLEEYRKKVYRKMEKYTVFGREHIQRVMREVEKEMVGEKVEYL